MSTTETNALENNLSGSVVFDPIGTRQKSLAARHEEKFYLPANV
jgi:hypothetical protein